MRSATKLEVLFESAAWIAVRKPVGWLTTGLRTAGVEDVLTERVAAHLAARGNPRQLPHPLSRLDVDVSGVVLFARDAAARELADRARRAGSYARGYRALVAPAPETDEGAWTWPVGHDPRAPRRRTTYDPRAPQEAESGYRVRARSATGAYAELALEPRTGRTHQLRVHAQRAGCPILGDPLYRGLRNVPGPRGAVLAARRTMLHCAWVEVPSGPLVECAPPADYAALWAALERA